MELFLIFLVIGIAAYIIFYINNRQPEVVEVNKYSGDPVISVETPSQPVETQVAVITESVNTQITDAVTQTVVEKKTRKPRKPKAEVQQKEKAAKTKKPAAKRVAKKSKNA